jgi:ubiquinone/menaquinone biosynthesis C-methylase UbiE
MVAEWAKLVGKQGKIYAIDISEEQLALAKDYLNYCDIDNVEYICIPVHELESLSLKVDVVYSRFTLEHVQDQENALKNMMSLLCNGGHLFCEALVCHESLFCDPHSEAFQHWKEAILLQTRLNNTDYHVGQKLFTWFKKFGIVPESYQIKQPVMIDKEIKKNFLTGLHGEELQNRYVEKGFYSKDEIQRIAQEASEFLQTDCFWSFPQYLQIMGRKLIRTHREN